MGEHGETAAEVRTELVTRVFRYEAVERITASAVRTLDVPPRNASARN
jgi:hypothetical protein